MPAKIIDGKKIASELEKSLEKRINALKEKGITPSLAVILVGEDEASEIYVRKKEEACARLGLFSRIIRLSGSIRESELIKEIERLNVDERIHGILVQLPLPDSINEKRVIGAISPLKDVDGFALENIGRLVQGDEFLVSCTARGIIRLIESTGVELKGKHVCVIGHGSVGLPLSIMLLNRNATLTICDKFTQNLGQLTRNAQILISATGVPGLVKAEMVCSNAIVVDVGISRIDGKLCGDVAFDEVKEKASFITPVPGGVGPMTVACLMENTVIAAENFADATGERK